MSCVDLLFIKVGCDSEATVKEFNEAVNEHLTQTMISKVRQTSGAVVGRQKIKFEKITCAGKATFGNISQKMVATFNFKRVLETTDSNEFKNIISNAVKQGAATSSRTKSEFLSGGAPSDSATEIHNKNVSKVTDSYNFNDFTHDVNQVTAVQEIGFKDLNLGSDCSFENISQDLYLEMLITQMSKQITSGFRELTTENKLKQKGDAEADSDAGGLGGIFESIGKMVGSIFSAPVLLILGIILFVVMIGMVIKLFSGGSNPDPAVAAMMMQQNISDFDNMQSDVQPTEVGDESTEESPA